MKRDEYEELERQLREAAKEADSARLCMLQELEQYIGTRAQGELAKQLLMIAVDEFFLQRGELEKSNKVVFEDNPMGTLAVVLSTALRGLHKFDISEAAFINTSMREALKADEKFEQLADKMSHLVADSTSTWKQVKALDNFSMEVEELHRPVTVERHKKVREMLGGAISMGDTLEILGEFVHGYLMEEE